MARKKISEYRAKALLTEAVETPYRSVAVNIAHPFSPKDLDIDRTYVVKVDAGIKKRMKSGLIFLNQSVKEIPQAISSLQKKGYENFIVEPFIPHKNDQEKYFSMSIGRDGITILYSLKGGIDVEDNQDAIKKIIVSSPSELHSVAKALSLGEKFLDELFVLFSKYHFTLLEINPLVVTKNDVYFLDVAAEVDTAGEFFVDGAWSDADFRESGKRTQTSEELAIDQLSRKSQASFTLDVLHPDGAVFMLLSGGGASIVLADEVYNVGKGKLLANYGEYSGNPNSQEVYLYTKNLVSLLLQSKAKKKVLVIAGGVANFTDIRLTFAGIIKALEEKKDALKKQNIKVYVRRGGPHQSEGLSNMREFLQEEQLLGNVSGPEMPLQEIITLALKEI